MVPPAAISQTFAAGGPWVDTVEVTDRTEQLYRRFAPLIHRRCLGLLVHPQEALDATHDVFLKVCDALPSFRGEAEITTWIYRVATNHCLNLLRTQRTRLRLLRGLVGAQSEAYETDDVGLMRRRQLQDLLRSCAPQDVQLLVHRYFDDMTQGEIAGVLGVSERTVRSRLKRVLQTLRDRQQVLDALGA